MSLPLYLTYDDVLLEPGYSDLRRSAIDLSTILGKIKLTAPILSAPMDTVTESALAIALARLGGLGVIHMNMPITAQVKEVSKVKKEKLLVGAAIAYGDGAFERAEALLKSDVDLLVIDTAHGHSKGVIEMTKQIKKDKRFNKVTLVAGNVATVEGVRVLVKAGADVVKVGIGPGSICTTRVVAGIGVPQLSAVMLAVKEANKFKKPIIADGGINYSGDMVKALAGGAGAIMLGRLLAGTKESPGKLVKAKQGWFKAYRGMGSFEAMQKGSKNRYGQADFKTKYLVPEGVSARVPYVGSLSDYLQQMVGGIKSGFVYIGAKNLKEVKKKAKFIRITEASLKESHPHDLWAMQVTSNYNK
ncbi:IMP dehydrogenase [Patescibacteria group bacterium]|nr:IMP dehydrogenase [Patescibacteria group bacterium]